MNVALVFCAILGPYAVSTLVAGHLIHKVPGSLWLSIGGGWLSLTIGYLLLGPSLMESIIPGDLWVKIVALVLVGSGLGLTTVPTFEALRRAAMEAGFSDDIKTYGIISGTFNAFYCLGEAVGPVVAGFVDDLKGFQFTMLVAMIECGCLVALSVLSYLLSVYPGMRCQRREAQQEPPAAAEARKSSLISPRDSSPAEQALDSETKL
ncbi:unnamed protein product [Notodromas monacha]|uniref:Major facilitator superfamily (MFS) profile domain-containing protein n=1 Tax=Notodromas monacha TaxID=399045 RepID=A0A7R9C2F7_9CRUS|nr:unnamed protein product [Notodromas monacha]CAG0924937.1 unnamed protein product [Notodromas monacha]